MNVRRSAFSAITFDIGFPAPCPAAVSTRNSTGASHAWALCRVAANFNE